MKSLQILNESPLDFVHIFPLHFIGKSFVEVFSLKCRGIYIFKKITKYFPLKFKGCYLFLHNSVCKSVQQKLGHTIKPKLLDHSYFVAQLWGKNSRPCVIIIPFMESFSEMDFVPRYIPFIFAKLKREPRYRCVSCQPQ